MSSTNNVAGAAPPAAPTTAPNAEAPIQQANEPVTITPEDDESTDDAESEFGARSIPTSSTSVSSSIFDFRVENGRTYHSYKEGKYSIPNDESENERLDLQHNLFLLTFDNALGLAPPCQPGSNVKRVLDVGTGTGIWAMDFGDDHPEAEVLGTDLSPSMPAFVPSNVKFEIDDLDDDWIYSRPFDYIHSRMMNSSIMDWKVYLQKCFGNLTPGGYCELQEIDLFPQSDDGTLKPDHALSKWTSLLYEATVKLGRPYQEIPPLVHIMKQVGFVDVEIHVFKWPANGWPKDPKFRALGIWHCDNITSGLEAFSMAPFTRALGWKKDEVQVFLIDVRKDIKDRSIHTYWPIYSLFGRKPEEEKKA